MTFCKGYTGKYLEVDLGDRTSRIHDLPEGLLRAYIGGAGLACRILYDRQTAGSDPLGPESMLVIAAGPLTDPAVPGGGSLEICARSPLTGGWAEARLGTDAGFALRRAGWEMILIRGASATPIALVVDDGSVDFVPAEDLSGLPCSEKERHLADRLGDGFEVLSIGPAGERQVPFASVLCGHRAAGRCGMGAVMGAKRVLAIALRGSGAVKKASPGKWAAAVRSAHQKVRENPMSSEFRKGGTMGGMPYSDASGDFPSRNWQSNSNGKGQAIHDRFYGRNFVRAEGCYRGCPVRCGRKVHVPEGPLETPVHDGGEYESISAFTAFVDCDDVDAAVRASFLCNEYGLDTISTGAVIAFAFECADRGLLPREPEPGVRLEWGHAAGLPLLVERIAKREGIGDRLAQGVRTLAGQLGPGACAAAVHVKGLEGAAHDPRSGKLLGLTYGTNSRGMCHIHPVEGKDFDADKVTFGLERFGLPDPETVPPWSEDNKGAIGALLQDFGVLFEMFATCKFYSYCGLEVEDYRDLINAATGWDMSAAELLQAGERVNNLQRLFNLREGFTSGDDLLPERVTQVPAFGRYANQPDCVIRDFPAMLADYYQARGWDREGVPTDGKLAQLGLEDKAL